jgi:hypothetical protein
MTDQPETLSEALDDHDVTLALTPGQVLVFLVGLYLVMRFLRGLRR